MADTTNDINQIRKRMAEIRMELHEDVQGVVAGTEAAFDWQYYVRLYPWGALAAACVVGYLVVPRKRKVQVELAGGAPETRRTEPHSHPHPRVEVQEQKKQARRKSGMLGMVFGFLSPIVVRAAQNYASQYVENWIQQQSQANPYASAGEPGVKPGPGLMPGPPIPPDMPPSDPYYG